VQAIFRRCSGSAFDLNQPAAIDPILYAIFAHEVGGELRRDRLTPK
jgi:hypothetical protein